MRTGLAFVLVLLVGAALAGCTEPTPGTAGTADTDPTPATDGATPTGDASPTPNDSTPPGNDTGPDPGADDGNDTADGNQSDDDPADEPEEEPERRPASSPSDPTVFTCDGQTVDERFATHGAGDRVLPSLAWAALKTGFRFAVAWESDDAYAGTLHYQVDGGAWRTASESLPRSGHAIVVDDLPEGKALCFYVADGSGAVSLTHGVRTENAMTSYDEATGTYTINLLTLVNFPQDRDVLEGGYDIYARTLWDMTDGHVRAGTNIVLYEDPQRTTFGFNGLQVDVSGDWIFDVVFQPDNPPAAGYTWIDAIQDEQGWIVMNSMHEAPPVTVFANPEREVGMVLAHEVGHYALGALDLYTDAGLGPDCYDPSTEISVMGGNRGASELDDETNRCPNEDLISGYVPSWTKLRQRFVEVPERPEAPDPGPDGDGGAYTFAAYDMGPAA